MYLYLYTGFEKNCYKVSFMVKGIKLLQFAPYPIGLFDNHVENRPVVQETGEDASGSQGTVRKLLSQSGLR